MHSCGYDDVPGSPPIRPSAGHGYHIGAHYGLIGTLMAVVYRDMAGEGQYVDASIHEACSCTTEAAMPQYIYMKNLVRRQTGRHHAPTPTPKTLSPTKDGKLVNLFALATSINAWRTMVSWLDEKGMAEDLNDDKYRDTVMQRVRSGPEVDHINQVLRKFIAQQDAEESYREAQTRRFAWGVIRSPEETLDDQHLWDRDLFEEIEHPELGRSFVYPGRPYVFNKTPWHTGRAPLLGEHNRPVYVDELGLSEREYARLQRDGVI